MEVATFNHNPGHPEKLSKTFNYDTKIINWGDHLIDLPYGSWIYNYLCNRCLSPLIL